MPPRPRRLAAASGRQYHLDIGPGDVAERVLLVGDPERVERIARRFTRRRVERRHREYVTVTGRWNGLDVTALGTGIGPDNTEIALVELTQVRRRLTILRVGTCGGLQRSVRPGDLVVSTAAVRLENTSLAWVPEGWPAVADPRWVLALEEGARQTGARVHVGLTGSAPGFYGAQGRRPPGFPPPRRDAARELAALGVLNLEMETSVLFTLAGLAGHRAGAVCAVLANRATGRVLPPSRRRAVEDAAIDAAFRALAAST